MKPRISLTHFGMIIVLCATLLGAVTQEQYYWTVGIGSWMLGTLLASQSRARLSYFLLGVVILAVTQLFILVAHGYGHRSYFSGESVGWLFYSAGVGGAIGGALQSMREGDITCGVIFLAYSVSFSACL